ncbi:MAG: hypothetical protein ACXAAO_01810 [Candidatus Thorarchaeota archaeon]|jgi:hypothetical protein
MSTSVRSFSRWLANGYTGYIIAFFVGVGLFLIMLFINAFNIQTLYISETALFLLSVSGIVMKFLSGLGVMLTYASVCSIVFRLLAEQVRGNRRRLASLKLILVLPILAILGYAIYTLLNALVYSQILSLFENLAAVYGIWSLMIIVYLVPVVQGKYNPTTEKGTIEKVGEKVKHSIWSGYQAYIWRDYGKVQSAEFDRYHGRLVLIRAILSAVLLLPIALVLMLFPPLGLLSVMLWFRIISLNYKPFSKLERFLLSTIVVVVLCITTYLFLAIGFPSLQVYLDFSYGIGIFFSVALLAIVIWQS